LILPL